MWRTGWHNPTTNFQASLPGWFPQRTRIFFEYRTTLKVLDRSTRLGETDRATRSFISHFCFPLPKKGAYMPSRVHRISLHSMVFHYGVYPSKQYVCFPYDAVLME